MRRPGPLAAALLALTLPLAACQSEAKDAVTDKPPAEVLKATKQALDSAKAVHLQLTSTDVPPRTNGVTAAEGDGVVDPATPKFKGSITGTVKGVSGTVELVTIGDQAWMKFFTPDYVKTDLKTLGAPNPSTFFDPERGISSLLTATTNPTKTEKIRKGSEILTQYTGTLLGKTVSDLLAVGGADATFKVTYGITDAGQLRTATITGPFFGATPSTYTATVTKYGESVAISEP